MKFVRPTLVALVLMVMVSSTALAGNIGGMRSSGNIGGLRSAGNIGGMRSAGNIGGTRSAAIPTQGPSLTGSSETGRFNVDSALSGSFAGLIRMLFEAGALL